MSDVQNLPDIELPTKDGKFGFYLCYNGEVAWDIKIDNLGGLISEITEPKTHVVAKLTVTPCPINGGLAKPVTIDLTLQGED